jgi:3-methyladenine DNA glycosylase AlkC
MAETLKARFDAAVVRGLSRDLQAAWPEFPAAKFVREATRGLDDLELLDRGRHVASALAASLPPDFPSAAAILERALGPRLDSTEGNGMTPFRFLPYSEYVARHGLAHFDEAMRLQYELTKRFTSEFCVRPFLAAEPERTLARLTSWVDDPDVHVRRWISEGIRPRLPWAPRLPAFQRDPTPVLALLERLRDDPERYVQRSVANCLNDVSKDHPDRVVATCAAWSTDDTPESRRWIVRHALRGLVKRGHPGALAVLGVGEAPQIVVEAARISPRRVEIGGHVELRFGLRSTASHEQRLEIDYAVHFVKANGEARPKVFKLARTVLRGGDSVELSTRLSLRQLTTRKHYPGHHAVELRVNGVVHPIGGFSLIAARGE